MIYHAEFLGGLNMMDAWLIAWWHMLRHRCSNNLRDQPYQFICFSTYITTWCFSVSHSILYLFISSESTISLSKHLPIDSHCLKIPAYSIRRRLVLCSDTKQTEIIDPLLPSVPFFSNSMGADGWLRMWMMFLHSSRIFLLVYAPASTIVMFHNEYQK